MTTKADRAVDSAAEKLERFVRRARAEGGAKAQVAESFEGDPEFLRKLKPSLVAARLRGHNPPVESTLPTEETQTHNGRPSPPSPRGRGPSPLVVIGAAFALGILVAKVIDWRSHAHPRA